MLYDSCFRYTPIISLLKTNQLDLLQKLFQNVHIPYAVYQELIQNIAFQAEAEKIKACNYIIVDNVTDQRAVMLLQNFAGLDLGESESIILADEKKSDVLLIDEHKGRQTAKKIGIKITGTIGIIGQAFDEGFLSASEVEMCIQGFRDNNIHISETLYQNLRNRIR